MSLCYDGEKWLMITFASVAIILTVVVLLSSLDSKVYGVTVNEKFFSLNLSNNWAYVRGELPNAEGSGILLIPSEFSDTLMNAFGDTQKLFQLFQNLTVWSVMAVDTSSPFRNDPLEIYVQHVVNASSDLFRKFPQVPTLIDGERALKIWGEVSDNSTITDRMVGYYVIHEGIPYRLEYYATEKDFQKYLPQFEQMVKTFKFVKAVDNATESSPFSWNTKNTITNASGTGSEKPRTLMDCYTSWVSWSFIANAFLPIRVDISDPDIKQMFVNMCDHVHNKTGIWLNIMTDSQNGTLPSMNATREELLKYYPNGILPDSVQELFNQMSSLMRE